MNPTIDVTSIPNILRFQLTEEHWLEFDILEAQLTFETLARTATADKSKTPEQMTWEVLQGIQKFVVDQHGVQLSVTQANTLQVAIRAAFAQHKKKLETTLHSLIGLDAPRDMPTPKQAALSFSEKSHASMPNGKSKAEPRQVSSHPGEHIT